MLAAAVPGGAARSFSAALTPGPGRQVLDHSEDVNDAKKEAKSVREEIVSVSAALAGGVPSSKQD